MYHAYAACPVHHTCDCVEQELLRLSNKIKELEKEVVRLQTLSNEREQTFTHLLDCCYCNTGLCANGRLKILAIAPDHACYKIKCLSPK